MKTASEWRLIGPWSSEMLLLRNMRIRTSNNNSLESDKKEFQQPAHFLSPKKSLSLRMGEHGIIQCTLTFTRVAFCLENPRDGGAWWAAVYGVAESDTTEAT